MTDDLLPYGLGALPDAPDERDYPISALYASEGLAASVVLPASYAAAGMPPVLDQHATPMCVAFSSSAVKGWQDSRDQEAFFDFDEGVLPADRRHSARRRRPRRCRARVRPTSTRAQELLHLAPQVGKAGADHVPHEQVVDACVAVDQDVAERDDAPVLADPAGGLRIQLRQLAKRLADDLELALDRGPHHRVGG